MAPTHLHYSVSYLPRFQNSGSSCFDMIEFQETFGAVNVVLENIRYRLLCCSLA